MPKTIEYIKLKKNDKGYFAKNKKPHYCAEYVILREQPSWNGNKKRRVYSYRLCIPKSIVIALGWIKGDEIVTMVNEDNELVFVKKDYYSDLYNQVEDFKKLGLKLGSSKTTQIIKSVTSSFYITVPIEIVRALNFKERDIFTYKLDKGHKLIFRKNEIDFKYIDDKPKRFKK